MEALPFVLAPAGLVLVVLGYFGWVGRLPRNRAAGGAAQAGAVATWLMPPGGGVVTVLYVVTGGMPALVIAGGVMGVRAARNVPD